MSQAVLTLVLQIPDGQSRSAEKNLPYHIFDNFANLHLTKYINVKYTVTLKLLIFRIQFGNGRIKLQPRPLPIEANLP